MIEELVLINGTGRVQVPLERGPWHARKGKRSSAEKRPPRSGFNRFGLTETTNATRPCKPVVSPSLTTPVHSVGVGERGGREGPRGLESRAPRTRRTPRLGVPYTRILKDLDRWHGPTGDEEALEEARASGHAWSIHLSGREMKSSDDARGGEGEVTISVAGSEISFGNLPWGRGSRCTVRMCRSSRRSSGV